jgi:hypothetical protein
LRKAQEDAVWLFFRERSDFGRSNLRNSAAYWERVLKQPSVPTAKIAEVMPLFHGALNEVLDSGGWV